MKIIDAIFAVGKGPAWTPSNREEVISALWFIVAYLAELNGASSWAVWFFMAHACFGSLEAIKHSISEHFDERDKGDWDKQPPPPPRTR